MKQLRSTDLYVTNRHLSITVQGKSFAALLMHYLLKARLLHGPVNEQLLKTHVRVALFIK